MNYYVYRFLDNDGDIVYVGKTTDLDKRMYTHFTGKGHLPMECYESVDVIQYIECINNTDMSIKELYFINKLKPKYNVKDKSSGELTIEEFDNLNWNKEYEIKLKENNNSIINHYENEISRLQLEIDKLNKINVGVNRTLFELYNDYSWYKYLAISYRHLISEDDARVIDNKTYCVNVVDTDYKNFEINGKHRK